MSQVTKATQAGDKNWLARYYAVRAAFSVVWVAAAVAVGHSVSPMAGALMVIYPAWDAAANYRDVSRNGGLAANPTQAFNVLVSIVVTIGVGVGVASNAFNVLLVFGAWAFLAGLMQLATGIRRWRSVGAQWPMILSGAQSGLAGVFMLKRAMAGTTAGPIDVAVYAAFGAFYFLISAISLAVSDARRRRQLDPTPR